MSLLPREVLKWLQSLDLSFPVRNVRRDFSNGFLIAEIFSWYFQQDIQMHSYDNGKSLPTKLGNWSQLERFFKREGLDIPHELVDGTIHCKPDAAELLVQLIYTKLTNRTIKRVQLDHEIDFTDRAYQVKLPLHARSTASQSVKNNLKITEFSTEPNLITCQQKAQNIIDRHIQHRREERYEEPERFDMKPTLGQMSPRKVPPPTNYSEEDAECKDAVKPAQLIKKPTPTPPTKARVSEPPSREHSMVQFKEINVKQLDQNSQHSMRLSASSSRESRPALEGY
ncbi:spermatogenesis-associated protein 4-like [Saccoglossus kowalevskii]|uniref:Spermatogenesis-associated protein 4-like n=1 Tax=Saccoglossus kowalevskii TaxID=10224 RepID=A0ABM0GQL0_SACKO|nr:PREDICTED: spermatogenesis-associated protein 4-like [Saccoglossus kowalevskii]